MTIINSKYYISNSFKEIILSIFKKKNKNFINTKIKKIINSSNFLLTNFGRTSLYVILLYIKKKNNFKNEVLVSSYNFHEVINMIIYAGLKPVFYDLEKNSLNADKGNIKKKINNNTLAIIITHFNGFNKTTKELKILSKKKKIFLIEDCAIALNTRKIKNNISNFGDFSFFSLNFTKNLSSITGGLIKSSKKNIREIRMQMKFSKFRFLDNLKNFISLILIKILLYKYFYFILYFLSISTSKPLRQILNFNFKKTIKNKIPQYYLNDLPRLNYNLLSFNFKNLHFENNIRIKNNNYYYNYLKNNKKIINLITKDNLNLVTLEYPILFKKKIDKINFLKKIDKAKLDVRRHYYFNCYNIPYLKRYKKENMMNSSFVEKNLLCLPNNPNIKKEIVEKFSNILQKLN